MHVTPTDNDTDDHGFTRDDLVGAFPFRISERRRPWVVFAVLFTGLVIAVLIAVFAN